MVLSITMPLAALIRKYKPFLEGSEADGLGQVVMKLMSSFEGCRIT